MIKAYGYYGTIGNVGKIPTLHTTMFENHLKYLILICTTFDIFFFALKVFKKFWNFRSKNLILISKISS